MLTMAAALIFCSGPLNAAEPAKIVNDGLSHTLSSGNLKVVSASFLEAEDADLLFKPNAIKRGLSYIDREQKKAINAAQDADVSPDSRFRTLKHFGAMLRAVNDFYSRTNYIEIQAARLNAKFGSRGYDPYSMELADWGRLSNNLENEPKLEAIKSGSESSPVGNSTHEKVAYELAVRETARQWDILETLIKGRYQGRALTILTALKEASCPAKDPDSLD